MKSGYNFHVISSFSTPNSAKKVSCVGSNLKTIMGEEMKRKLVIAIALVICVSLGVCGVIGVTSFISTGAFRATETPTLTVLPITPIETPIVERILPTLTPLPGQVGIRPSQTAYSLTRTAYPTDIAFYTSPVPTKPVVINEGTATKYIKDLEALQTQVKTHPYGSYGLCNDGKYTSVLPKQNACHYDGGIFDWWGPTPSP